MIALEHIIGELGTEGPGWLGAAVGGWLAAALAALLAVRQAARCGAIGVGVAEAAHELRGPLCAARLALAGLERAYPDAPSVVRGVAAIDLELRRAGLAIDDLTSVEAGPAGRAARKRRPEREPVDLAALAMTAEPAWRALAAARAKTFELRGADRPAVVLGDPRRLLQGIENLVANACEHGRGAVRVTIVGDARCVRVDVGDEGQGPSTAAIHRARGRARAGWLRRRASSRGNGITIAARVAQDAGGRLVARSRADATVVSLELPSERPGASARRSPPARAFVARPRRDDRRPGTASGRPRAAPGRREPLAGPR